MTHADGNADRSLPPTMQPRRGFVGLVAGGISVVLGLLPAGLGTAFFLDPILRKRDTAGGATGESGDDPTAAGFIRLNLNFASLPADGAPVAAKVVADKVDAWNRFQNVEIGTIWVRRIGDEQVQVFNATCPHLSCAVDYRAGRNDFFCPCHTSSFALDGARTNQIPPRGMDQLDVKLDSATGAMWVKYQNFRAGTPEQIPVA